MAEMVEEDLHQFLHLRRIVLSEFLLELRGNVEVVGRLLLLLGAGRAGSEEECGRNKDEVEIHRTHHQRKQFLHKTAIEKKMKGQAEDSCLPLYQWGINVCT